MLLKERHETDWSLATGNTGVNLSFEIFKAHWKNYWQTCFLLVFFRGTSSKENEQKKTSKNQTLGHKGNKAINENQR